MPCAQRRALRASCGIRLSPPSDDSTLAWCRKHMAVLPSPRGRLHVSAPPAVSLRRRLLAWFERNQRDLPWRRPAARRDPYRIWLAETMLQQTRVPVVLAYYRRFLQALPTLGRLAAAPHDRVLTLWVGLGYYQRARNLHRAARTIVREHGGRFPQSLASALGLPGVGAYTARAILSIAYGQRLGVVDGNVARVLARLFLLHPGDRQAARARLQPLADRLVSPRRPGDFNQALMELGSTICLPKTPRCPACPLTSLCAARQTGIEHAWPPRRPRFARPRRRLALLVLCHRGRLLMVREGRGPFSGLWHFPYGRLSRGLVFPAPLRAYLRRRNARLLAPTPVLRLEHSMTTGNLDLHVFAAATARGRTGAGERWVAPGELRRIAVGAATRKVAAALPEAADPACLFSLRGCMMGARGA